MDLDSLVLLAAIGLDGTITGLRMAGREPSAILVVPIVSMLVEAFLGILLMRTVAVAVRRTMAARALLSRER